MGARSDCSPRHIKQFEVRSLMADNYLEKQREQYEARKAAWLKKGKPKKKSAHASIQNTQKGNGGGA